MCLPVILRSVCDSIRTANPKCGPQVGVLPPPFPIPGQSPSIPISGGGGEGDDQGEVVGCHRPVFQRPMALSRITMIDPSSDHEYVAIPEHAAYATPGVGGIGMSAFHCMITFSHGYHHATPWLSV